MRLGFNLKDHIKSNIYAYVLLTIAMAIGIVKSNLDVITMKISGIAELGQYINDFFHIICNNGVSKDRLIIAEFINIAKLLILVWVCGSSIIGIPVIFYIMYIKGYTLGLCSGVLIKSMGAKGINLITVGIIPKEIVYIPILIILGASGIKFSTYIIRSNKFRMLRRRSVLKEFGIYSITCMAMCIVSLGGIGIWTFAMKYINMIL